MNFSIVFDNLDRFAEGLFVTLQLTTISVFVGFCLAVPLSIMRLSKNPLLRLPVHGFCFFFRGTPLLVQLFLVYFGSGQFRDALEAVGLWSFFNEPYLAALLTLTLNTAAYTTEIFRGGIQSVPHGEIEAARACGMSGAALYRRIILPKALRIALPAYSNEVVFLFQATSLVFTITILDLTGVASVLRARSFRTYELFIFAGAIYLSLTYGILYVFKRVEFFLSGHLRERPGMKVVDKKVAKAAAPKPVTQPMFR